MAADPNDLFAQAGYQNDIDPLMMQAIAQVESGNKNYNADGSPVTSPTGVQGRMQSTMRTGQAYGVSDRLNDNQTIPGMTRYMSDNLNATKGDVAKALTRYNGGGDPNYVPKVYAEWNKLKAQQMAAAPKSQPAQPSQDDAFWSSLGTQSNAAPAATPTAQQAPVDDAFWSTLGTKQDTAEPIASPPVNNAIHYDPARLAVVGNSIARGLHQGLDVPAEALARGADWVAGKLGIDSSQGPQTAAADQQSNAAYDADPANRGFGPGVARLGGNMLASLPAALATGGLASGAAQIGVRGANALSPYLGAAVSAVPAIAGGAAAGATTAAQTAQSVQEGAGLGAGLGAGGAIIGNTVNGLIRSSSPAVDAAVNKFGIPLRAGQVSSNRLVRYLDDMTAPESSNVAQRAAVNDHIAKSMNITPDIAAAQGLPAGQITPQTMQAAKTLNGGIMNGVEARTTIPQSDPLLQHIADIEASASKSPSVFGDIKPHLDDVINTMAANDGTIPGKAYGQLVGHGSDLDSAVNSDNGTIRQYAGQIKSALQDAMQRNATPADSKAYADARLAYKNMMTVAPAVNKGIPGDISPLLLQGLANRSFKNNAFSGAGDLGDLGDLAQRYMKAPPQSGTEPREFIRNTMYGDVKGMAKMGLSATGGRLVQSALGANPLTGISVPSGVNSLVPSALLIRNQLVSPRTD